MDFLLLIALILLNGIFAMSEIAILTARKSALLKLSKEGRRGATIALKLMEDPTNFLSTVQIGITSIGLLNGVITSYSIHYTKLYDDSAENKDGANALFAARISKDLLSPFVCISILLMLLYVIPANTKKAASKIPPRNASFLAMVHFMLCVSFVL